MRASVLAATLVAAFVATGCTTTIYRQDIPKSYPPRLAEATVINLSDWNRNDHPGVIQIGSAKTDAASEDWLADYGAERGADFVVYRESTETHSTMVNMGNLQGHYGQSMSHDEVELMQLSLFRNEDE